MPELPDVTIYIEALQSRVVGMRLQRVRLWSPFVLRTVEPLISEVEGQLTVSVFRMGKRIVLGFENDVFLVIHLMIAGRLLWSVQPAKPGKLGVADFEFESGSLLLTEAGSKKRASISLFSGEKALHALDPGGIEPLNATLEEFKAALTAENRTLKRALANPKTFSGIGNAYSDEILHAARLSPLRLTRSLHEREVYRLYDATRLTLIEWTGRLRAEFAGQFPRKGQITAFRPEFAAHGKFGQPCPTCGNPIQRIRYAENETNYCAVCQNEGRLLADRALSRLLKENWTRTLEEMQGN